MVEPDRMEETTEARISGEEARNRPGELDTSFLQARGADEFYDSGDPEEAAAGFSVRRLLRMLLLGLTGFILGAVLFLPAESLWLKALNRLNTGATEVFWTRSEPAGLLGARIHDVRLSFRDTDLHFTQLLIEPGLLTPLTLRLATGEPELEASMSWSRRLTIRGETDTGVLLDTDVPLGAGSIQADLRFERLTDIPEQGTLTIQGLDVVLPNEFMVENLNLDLTKNGEDLNISMLTLDKPVPLKASGSLELNPENLRASSYTVSGKIRIGNKDNTFKKTGNLEELVQLSSMGNLSKLLR
jgi:hypothetical protein